MKALRLTALLIPVTLAGCLLTTGQFNIDVDLDDAFVTGTAVDRELVDMNTVDEYNDHKDDLVGLSDVAVVGTAQNFTGSPIEVEAWITREDTNYLTAATVRENAFKLWGPFALAGGETKRITWDDSAALFNATGRYVLQEELKGDGIFTVYFLNANAGLLTAKVGADAIQGGSDIELRNMSLILTIEGED